MHTNKKGPNSKYSFKFCKSNIVLANQIFVEQEAVKWSTVFKQMSQNYTNWMPQKETSLIYFSQLWVQLNGPF